MDSVFDKAGVHRARTLDYLRSALGDLASYWLDEGDVTDIMVNPARPGEPDGRLYVVRLGHPAKHIGFMSAHAVERLIVAVATTMNKEATADNAIVEGLLLLDGSRFTGIMRPVVPSPSLAIRRKASSVYTLAQYVQMGCMTDRQKTLIEAAITSHKNLLIVGGTGSGKTTLGNAVLSGIAELTPGDRLCAVEEVAELQNAVEDSIFMQADLAHPMRMLVKTALRLFPRRILIGEVRGGEALEMISAWNTGHDGGFCTLHSNIVSPEAALMRLEMLVSMATQANMQRAIGEAIDLIICVERTADHRRRVSQIVSVKEYDARTSSYILNIEGE